MKKAPDPNNTYYKCIKKRLNKIILNSVYNNKDVLYVINDAVKRVNKIIIKTYMLLRLWILDKYHKKQDIPKLNDKIIRIAFNTFINSKGKKGLGDNNKIILNDFKQYYNQDLFGDLEDGSKLSTVLSYSAITMITSIENNIRNNFISYLNRYIKSYFYKINEQNIEDEHFKKQLNKDLKCIINDIINNTLNTDIKYHQWIQNNRSLLVPVLNEEESIIPDLHSDPQRYLKYMIYMTGELEKMEKKQFQFFPLQTNAIPRHIQIDNKALIELFEDNVSEKFKEANNLKEILWINIFKLNCKIKNYSFDYCLITDGYTVSIRFISCLGLDKKNKKIKNMKKGKKDREQILEGLNKEDKKEKTKELKEINNKKEEKIKTEVKNKLSTKKNKKIKQVEFPYINDVTKEELEGKHIFIDPGKKALLTMIDDENKFSRYTNKQYLKETKRLKYNNKVLKIKTELGIKKEEEYLSNFNSKTININNFKDYIMNKLKVNNKVMKYYFDNRFRQIKWYSYINKKRTEDKLLNEIENTYSKDHMIIIGDWSIGKQMSNFISTPNLRLKRKLRERFKVYNIDEFKTSCINYKNENQCENLKLWFNNKYRKMHSILTFKMENTRLGCINRDKNGCNNIKKLFNSYIETGTIPVIYRR
jgi:hypothetical protein